MLYNHPPYDYEFRPCYGPSFYETSHAPYPPPKPKPRYIPIWYTHSGRSLLVLEMTTAHLYNALAYRKRVGKKIRWDLFNELKRRGITFPW